MSEISKNHRRTKMPSARSKEPGDNFYPDYSRCKTLTVGTDRLQKGHIYTIGSDGKVYKFGKTDVTGVTIPTPILNRGDEYANSSAPIVQAMNPAEPGKEVQCLMPGSRIGLEAGEALVLGTKIGYVTYKSGDSSDVHPNKAYRVDNAATEIGRIFEIPPSDYTGTRYTATVGDIIIVEFI